MIAERKTVDDEGPSRRVRTAAVAVLLVCCWGQAHAEYKVQRGDILDVTVFASPDLTRRATIDVDGQAHLPLIGAVDVAGLSLAEVRTKLGGLLASGKLVRVPEVTVEVAEYRPVYVKGDVLNAGAFPFRPGMTIRQLLALSGGSGLKVMGGGAGTAAGVADLRGDYAALTTELAARQAHLDRLRAQLGKTATVAFSPLRGRSLSPDLEDRLQSLETQQFDALRTDKEKTADHFKTLADFASDQLSTLDLQRKEVEQSVGLQSDEVEKVRGLFQKGMITSTRLTDEQRALAALKTQMLANIAQAGDVRRLRSEFDDRLRQSDQQRELATLQDFQQTLVDIEKSRIRLEAAGQKLLASKDAGLTPQAGVGDETTYTIFRTDGADNERITAAADTEVSPGDVVEVHSGDALALGPEIKPRSTASVDQSEDAVGN